ncbi:phage major capsid protein [Roseibacillus ishigakijimensis]|uniref:Phage major capsid protein n=1 Tax=Roseibacillus ishigakijimensis TaxID=454146 RepID=A0A934RQD8_9BACT|nr:phage major capsid protein [Roseibacillus ishigakijimensis]MBK1835013.1 phage major capsid protein [Roseibacillus ishigakijimensis]
MSEDPAPYRTRKNPEPSQVQTRALSIESFEKVRAEEEGKPDVYEFKLASDAPVEIWRDEFEILGHQPGEVRLDWLASGNAPLLWMHDRSQQLGIVESSRVEGGFLYCRIRFGSSDFAQEKKRDWDEGILKNVSVGYRVHAWDHVKSDDTGDYYRVTDWEPIEATLCPIPADRSVGSGRSYKERKKPALSEPDNKDRNMPKTADPPTEEPKAPKIDVSEVREQAKRDERERQLKIRNAAKGTKGYDLTEIAERAIDEGMSLDQFNEQALEHIRSNAPKLSQADIGATGKEQKRYSLKNVMDGIRYGNLEKVAGYELEMSRAVKEAKGKDADSRSVAIPMDILLRGWTPKNPSLAQKVFGGQRNLMSVSLTGGGQSDTVSNVVETELLDELFVESLREQSVLLGLGVTMIPGLVGDAEIPVELLNPEFYWIGEDDEPTEGNYQLGQVALNFKTLAARIPFTRRADKQSTPNIEGLLANSLRKGAALALENTAYNGAGTATEPEGILNTAGVGSVSSMVGTLGTYSRDVLIELRQALGIANAASPDTALLMAEHTAGEFAKVKTDAGSGLFVADYDREDVTRLRTAIGSARLTNLLPNTAAGDAASVVLYGKPSELYIGTWGAMEIDLDDTTKRNTGGKTLRVFLDADMAIPRPACFAVIDDLEVDNS